MHQRLLIVEVAHDYGPVHRGGSLLIYTIIPDVRHNADDFTPFIHRAQPDALTESPAWIVPVFARQVLGNECNGASVFDIGPGEIAARHSRRTDGFQETG